MCKCCGFFSSFVSDVLPPHCINKKAIISLSLSMKGSVGRSVHNSLLDLSLHLYEGLFVHLLGCPLETRFFIHKIARFYCLRSGKKSDEVDFFICEMARGKRTRCFAKLSHFQHRTYFIPGNERETCAPINGWTTFNIKMRPFLHLKKPEGREKNHALSLVQTLWLNHAFSWLLTLD